MKRSHHGPVAAFVALLIGCTSSPEVPEPTEADAPKAPAAASAPATDPPASAKVDAQPAGFVVSKWYDILPELAGTECPDGFNPTESEFFEVDMKEFGKAVKKIGYREAQKEFFPEDACQNPTAQKDPGFKTFDGPIPLAGLDLDGVDSKKDDGGPCAHDDFVGPNGETGIDSQHWRLLGCTAGYQPDGQIDRLYRSGSMIKEGYPILIELTGVDDRENDDEVEVRFFSSNDGVTMGSSGEVLPDLSLRVHENERYRSAPTPGKIENGVLTSEPIDIYLRLKQQVIDDEFFFRDARVRAEFLPDGKISGVLGFYWDAENFYDVNNDHTIGEYHSGRIAAETRGYMCAGIYNAIPRIADGHPDPETGECTSISAQMHFEGTPAFVIHDTTESASAPDDEDAKS